MDDEFLDGEVLPIFICDWTMKWDVTLTERSVLQTGQDRMMDMETYNHKTHGVH